MRVAERRLPRGLLDPESQAIAEAYEALPALRRQAGGLLSLDPQQDQSLGQTAFEVLASFIPGVGSALASRDIERARRAKDPAAAALAATEFVPFGRLGNAIRRDIFIGKSAKTWDAAAAKRAEEMEAKGADPETIWRQTGTFRGPEGELRQEISDVGAYLRQAPDIEAEIQQRKGDISAISERVKALKAGAKTQPDLFPREFNRSVRELAETKKSLQKDIKGNFGLEYGKTGYLGSRARLAMHHPEAFEAYPDLGQQLIVRREQPLGTSIRGQYSPDDNRIDIGSSISSNPQQASSTALHEFQHAIQQKEGFAKGGNVGQFTPPIYQTWQSLQSDLSKALTGGSGSSLREILENYDLIDQSTLKEIAKKYGYDSTDNILLNLRLAQSKRDPYEQYRRLAGEAEARAVQKRQALTQAERRKVFPLSSYDVPINELIINK